MEDTVIQIKNLSKEYKMYNRKKDRLLETLFPFMHKHKTFTALDNINLELKKGEILGILGKNGAGKSTLLKIITGVVTETCGEMSINGKISSLLELGTAFNGELTGYENIYQHGQVFGFTKEEIKKKEAEIIAFADIGDHLNQPVKTYSSGMFARLAFACAINVEPDILIVDEVLSVGDMAFQLKCFKKFEEFKKKNKTIIFVTHNIGDVIRNCNRTIIMENGKKIFEGNTKDGVDTYKKLITGNLNISEQEAEEVEKVEINIIDSREMEWKKHFNINPDMSIYGNKQAEVIDYGIFNQENEPVSTIYNNEYVTIKSKILFYEKVEEPIFTFTVKDFTGREFCGTNTSIRNIQTGKFGNNECVVCEFKQKLPLAPGKYTLSLSCTQIDKNGELVIINRNYDAILFEVLSKESVVGAVRLETNINIKKI